MTLTSASVTIPDATGMHDHPGDAFRTFCYGRPAMAEPSYRKLVGIVLILLLIVVWAAFVASLAQIVGRWPILIQAPFYLVMGIVWIIPLKPLVRWIQTGSFRATSVPHN
jgi:hypothetical protein